MTMTKTKQKVLKKKPETTSLNNIFPLIIGMRTLFLSGYPQLYHDTLLLTYKTYHFVKKTWNVIYSRVYYESIYKSCIIKTVTNGLPFHLFVERKKAAIHYTQPNVYTV